ncbi:MAG: prepilin-type N-terminal cleavage/methylation domain-containing protein [Campylobacteraceae bacterium]|nr:prepilin-type N-terminal cleavage/methylation domain-containing protein [Campylobacteraceae bacterium]
MKKRAFTMIEVIIVIILFGIIASIGAQIIAKMYINYLQARTINYLQSQSNIAVEQIAKRLQYRIKDTAVARMTNATGDAILPLNHQSVTANFNVIEWIGYSNEAMLGNPPGWSGFIDLDGVNTNKSVGNGTLSTPGSNLTDANNTIKVLSNNTVDLNSIGSGSPAALIFRQKPAGFDPVNGYGWRNGVADPNYLVQVRMRDSTTFDVVSKTPTSIFEHYYLAHTAYAISREATGNADDFNLVLYYNYQPWSGGTWNSTTTSKAVLAEHVNLFRVNQVGNTVRIKLCLHDAEVSGAGRKLVACKEEVIF